MTSPRFSRRRDLVIFLVVYILNLLFAGWGLGMPMHRIDFYLFWMPLFFLLLLPAFVAFISKRPFTGYFGILSFVVGLGALVYSESEPSGTDNAGIAGLVLVIFGFPATLTGVVIAWLLRLDRLVERFFTK